MFIELTYQEDVQIDGYSYVYENKSSNLQVHMFRAPLIDNTVELKILKFIKDLKTYPRYPF